MTTIILFYIFASILIISAILVITAKNSVHSVLFLILTFITASCLWIMLNIEFLALTLSLVYVGAVMVLFLFVVMMIDIDITAMRVNFWRNLPIATLLAIIILTEIILILTKANINIANTNNIDTTTANANQLGYLLYTQYSYPVELASLILLLALVASVAITLRYKFKNTKQQNINKQVTTNARDQLTLVDIKIK